MEENTFEHMFGENALVKMLETRIQEFITDDETKLLFEELIDLVNESNLNNEEIVNNLMNLPYNIAYAVLTKIDKNNSNLIEIYREKLYLEFLRDARNVSQKGVSAFERRFLTQPSNIEKFLETRILTRYELELLFIKVSKQTHLNGLSYKEKHEYQGEDKLLRQLSSAHAVLTNPRQSRSRDNLFNKVKKSILAETIKKFKTLSVNP